MASDSGDNPTSTPNPGTDADLSLSLNGLDDTGPFFLGEYDVTLDDKNRLMIPSDFRKEIDERRDGANLILLPGSNGRAWIFTEQYFMRNVRNKAAGIIPGTDKLNRNLALFGLASRVSPDKQGRILLNERLLKRVRLGGRELTLVGVGSHIQLWPREDWTSASSDLATRMGELMDRVKDDDPGFGPA